MAHDVDERRSKHHQDIGASSGGPSAKTKQLAKRKRPMPHDSSSEDSPPRGGTPESPDWYMFVLYLKISPMVKHQFVCIDYMRTKKDMHFNKILEACDFHEITELLQFKHN
jgi:hypothetical protein